MKHKMYNRFLSLALALALVVGMLPGMTFAGAVDTTAPQSQAEQVEELGDTAPSQEEGEPTPAPESSEEESSAESSQVEETPAPSEEPVQEPENNEDTESAFIPPVNFSNVAPLTDLNSQRTQMMMANAISPTEGEETAPDGLEISKNIYWDNEEHTYKIKLEAYTTGDITVSGGDPVPADIVLVLDQSGSMSESFGTMTGYYSVADNNFAAWNHKQNLYVKIGDEYIKVNVERIESGYWSKTYTYTYTYNGQQYEYTGTYEQELFGGDDRFPSELAGKLYFYGSANASRQEAMKQAVNNFIDSVHDDAVKNSVNHKIAIVKFAGNEEPTTGDDSYYSGGYKYNYSQIVKQLTDVSTGSDDLISSVNNLHEAGGTRVDYGLSRAKAAFSGSSSKGRNRIVVVFSDGEPSQVSDYSSEVANDAIKNAKDLKNDFGATVYSIGVFSGADGSNPGNMSNITLRANRFMHLISSNYPFATSMDRWDWGSLNPELEGTDKSYYLSASDTETLNEIFEKISDEVQGGGSSFPLGSDAVIKDVMSDYFEVATDNPNEIEVSYEVPTSFDVDGNVTAWTPDTSGYAPAIAKTFHENKSGIDVSGFDFNHNFVSETGRTEGDVTKPGDFHGRKIVITFPIEVKDGFLGGNNVPTNDSASGIYQNVDAEEPIGRFNVPNLNEEIEDYTLEGHDKTIHLTTSTDANGLFSSSLDPDGWNNDYVNIVYTVKNGDTVVGTYTIKAGETAGTWTGITDGKLNPEDCTDYTITCTVSPITNNPDSVSNQPVSAVPKTTTDPATVHVLIPKVSVKDSEIDLGETANFSDNYNANGVKNQWVDRQEHTENVPSASTTEPEVDLSYQFVRGSNPGNAYPASYNPTQDSDFKIVVKIGDRILQLTNKEYTLTTNAIEHNNCIEPTEGNDHDFTIHVHTTNGMLVIQKKIEGGLAANGEPVFDFKVESPNGTVYYYHVIGQADGTVTATPEDGVSLPAGDYTVTELYNQNYEATDVQITGGDQTTTTPGNNYSVIVSVKPNGTTTVTFTNTADDTKIPSDSGATQNIPKWNSNNLVGWKPDETIVDGNVQTDETSN